MGRRSMAKRAVKNVNGQLQAQNQGLRNVIADQAMVISEMQAIGNNMRQYCEAAYAELESARAYIAELGGTWPREQELEKEPATEPEQEVEE